jgi:hypothetical protein
VLLPALVDVNHVLDASTRGVGFEIPEPVGGASAQTQPAVHATRVILECWSLAWNGSRSHCCQRETAT